MVHGLSQKIHKRHSSCLLSSWLLKEKCVILEEFKSDIYVNIRLNNSVRAQYIIIADYLHVKTRNSRNCKYQFWCSVSVLLTLTQEP